MVEFSSLKVSSVVKHILVVGPSWVGDMVMAQSLFMTLKQRHPACLIDVLAPAWSFPLLKRMPEVNRAIAMPLGHGQFGLWPRIRLGWQLRVIPNPNPSEGEEGREHSRFALQKGYDQAIVLPNSWKSALIPFFADIPLRTGYIGESRWGLLNDARSLDKKRLKMTVQRFVALGLGVAAPQPPDYPIPKLRVDPALQSKACVKFGLGVSENILAICPGAEFGPAKRWPVEHFAEVARQKHLQGWQIWLFGSDKDLAVAERINVLAGGVCRNFAGKTSLGEAVDLLSLSRVVVSNDSGLMHVAAALDKKLIAIYGSSDPGFTPPLNEHALIIDLKLDCSPCFKRDCPLGHTRCLTEITPLSVLDAIDG